jgi:hypothetical protein
MDVGACTIYDLRSMIPGCMIGFGVFVSASWIPIGGCVGFCLFYVVMMSICFV